MVIDQAVTEKLIELAKSAAEKAYAPYSGYRVGAALLTHSDKIFTGCNVENSSYSMTICAERTAIGKAVSEGETSYQAIAVYVDSETPFPPCGACRQVMAEFADDMTVIIANRTGQSTTCLKKLLPGRFKLHNAR